MNPEQHDLLQRANELLQTRKAEEAIEILSQTFGPDHLYVAIGYNALGAQQYEDENWSGARLSIEQARIIWEQNKGRESAEVGACANNLGRVYEHLGDFENGVKLHSEALAIRKIVLGDNPDTGMSYLSLGAALLSSHNPQEAKECFEQGLELYKRIDMSQSPEAKACSSNLDLCHKALGK